MLAVIAGLAWLAVAGYGYQATSVESGDDWEGPYMLFTVTLLVGAVLAVVAAAWLSRQGGRRRLRTAGLIVSGVGVAATIVAWALPLWMTVLGIGFAMIAVASGPRERRAVAVLAAGQLVGLVALFIGIAAEVGDPDSYGDYPAAGGIALIVTAFLTIAAMVQLTRTPEAPLAR
jgi:MFS family permease